MFLRAFLMPMVYKHLNINVYELIEIDYTNFKLTLK